MTGPDGRWHLGIGDPTIGGWVTVVAYGSATCLALLAFRRQVRQPLRPNAEATGSRGHSGRAWFWLLTAVFMVLLGVNKQLDLQSWLTEVGRDFAYQQGWYDRRRTVQALFVVCVGTGGVAASAGLAVLLRRTIGQVWEAFLGLCVLVIFVVVRAASFHHIDGLLYGGSLPLNGMIELGGICLVAASAWRNARRT